MNKYSFITSKEKTKTKTKTIIIHSKKRNIENTNNLIEVHYIICTK